MSLEHATGPDVTFGLFDWVDADGVREAGQLYRERLDLVADAEAPGSTSTTWPSTTARRSAWPRPRTCSWPRRPRTSGSGCASLVYVLPLYHPARLTEESPLDQLSGGRLEIGFGKGGNPYELLAYGIEPGPSAATTRPWTRCCAPWTPA